MPSPQVPFSKRHGYARVKEITIREDAPANLRHFILKTARQCGLSPAELRDTVCDLLNERPDPNNWSDPNVWLEVQDRLYEVDWYLVYDIVEAIWQVLNEKEVSSGQREPNAQIFEESLNKYFYETGIGWQLSNGEILIRGQESFEVIVKTAAEELSAAGRTTAGKHVHEALTALSRRPEPDLSGAVYHAIGALECVARDVAGDPNATLGEILKKQPDLVPRPLDTALAKIWGFASNVARHVKEGHEPQAEEAELLVGLSASAATYLNRKALKHYS